MGQYKRGENMKYRKDCTKCGKIHRIDVNYEDLATIEKKGMNPLFDVWHIVNTSLCPECSNRYAIQDTK
jgi:hypothetical protein